MSPPEPEKAAARADEIVAAFQACTSCREVLAVIERGIPSMRHLLLIEDRRPFLRVDAARVAALRAFPI